MPDKYVVPQFIDSEDKILGPITVRQFMICLIAVFVIFIEYSVMQLVYFILLAIPTAALAGIFAFAKINGHPFHIFFLNVLQSWTRPGLRTWRRELSDGELRAMIVRKPEAKIAPAINKARPSLTHLRDLSLTVNTGGVYNPDAD